MYHLVQRNAIKFLARNFATKYKTSFPILPLPRNTFHTFPQVAATGFLFLVSVKKLFHLRITARMLLAEGSHIQQIKKAGGLLV